MPVPKNTFHPDINNITRFSIIPWSVQNQMVATSRPQTKTFTNSFYESEGRILLSCVRRNTSLVMILQRLLVKKLMQPESSLLLHLRKLPTRSFIHHCVKALVHTHVTITQQSSWKLWQMFVILNSQNVLFFSARQPLGQIWTRLDFRNVVSVLLACKTQDGQNYNGLWHKQHWGKPHPDGACLFVRKWRQLTE